MKRSSLLVLGLGLTLLLGLATVFASSARAYEIDNFSANIVKADGTTFESQAGGHPYQGIISFDTKRIAAPPIFGGNNDGETETIRVDTPPGLVPNPESVPKCTQTQLEANGCPADSQIGRTELRLSKILSDGSTPGGAGNPFNLPAGSRGDIVLKVGLFNMVPYDGQLARFSFNPTQAGPQSTGHIVDIVGDMRPDDNGLFFTISEVARPTPSEPGTPTLTGSTLTFWGEPGSTDHQAERGASSLQLVSLGGGVATPPGGAPITLGGSPGNQPAGTGGRAFLSSPTSCAGPQQAKLTLTSYQGDQPTKGYTVGASTDGLQGCGDVPFASTTSFGPSSMQSDAPVPLSVTLDVPQTDDVGTLATSHVKKVSVTLPPGMTISPSAANGLEACTDAQFAKGTNDPIACPASSRIGAVQITSNVLDTPLAGSVYVGQPLPGDRYRLFLNADGHGISIRLKGTVRPDATTGQVTAVFDDNPQLPFSQFKLDFDGGSKAIIASPQACGTLTGNGVLTPWSGNASTVNAANVDVTGCFSFPFAPGFGVSTASPASGAYSPLSVDVTRADSQQFLSGISATLPPGLLAKIKGVTQCSEAQVAAESCPQSSQIGVTSVTAGPGSAPYALSGPVYLTGGYKGGSFGSVAIIHAVAGPYDLGNVVVRQSLRIDPNDARVSVVSDPLPQIKEGIVLRLRQLTLNVNRPGFMRNPTSCGTGRIEANLTSPQGTAADRAANLDFTGCQNLAFAPKIKLAVANKTQMGKFKYPRLDATVTQKEGEAGIRSTSVALPKDVALAAKNAQGLCEVAQAAVDQCPKASIVGSAVADTPILNKQLKGPVYFVKGERKDPKTGNVIKTLPTLFVPLRGETTIYLRAQTAVSHDRLVTTFPAIPDAPITSFKLSIDGGKHGIIQATRDLCTSKTLKGSVRFAGHNGKKAATQKPKIGTACGSAKKTTTKKSSTKKKSTTKSTKATTKK